MKEQGQEMGLFEDRTFLRGEPWAFEVVEKDWPTEFTAGEYLAAATIGQEVAVGCIYLERCVDPKEDPDHFEVMSVPVAIVPGRGVWVTAAVFENFRSATESMNEQMKFVLDALGTELEGLPLFRAFVPVLERTPPRPAHVAEHEYYDRSLYANVAAGLRQAPGYAGGPQGVDALVARLLDIGYWVEGKDARNLGVLLHCLPRWLVDVAKLGGVGDTVVEGLCA